MAQPEPVKESRAAWYCDGWCQFRVWKWSGGEGGLTAHLGTSLMDWAVDVEKRVRREMAVVVYFMIAGSW